MTATPRTIYRDHRDPVRSYEQALADIAYSRGKSEWVIHFDTADGYVVQTCYAKDETEAWEIANQLPKWKRGWPTRVICVERAR